MCFCAGDKFYMLHMLHRDGEDAQQAPPEIHVSVVHVAATYAPDQANGARAETRQRNVTRDARGELETARTQRDT